ncbi:MAG: hypothetical protein ACTSSA_12485, partial [Candidatus Freyarchaeota archaeon]
DDALAYLETPFGPYALTKPVERKGLPPKNFLVRMTEKTVEERKKAGVEFKPAQVRCVETKTGAKFCLVNYDRVQLEAIEMCNPIFEFKRIIETKEPPSIEECRKAGKNDFLVIKMEEKKG